MTTNVSRTLWRLAGPASRRTLVRVVGWRAAQAVFAGLPVAGVLLLVEAVRAGTLDTAGALTVTVVCLVALAGQYLCARRANLDAWVGGMQVVRDLRLDAIDRIRRLPLGFHLRRRSGDTVTALTADTAILERFVVMTFPDVVGAVVFPVVVLVVLLVADPVLAAVAAVSVLLGLPAWLWVMRRMRTLAARRQDVQAETTATLLEYLQGLPTLRAFGGVAPALRRLETAVHRARGLHVRLAVLLTPPMVLFSLVVELGIALVVLVVGVRLGGGVLDPGTAVVFLLLVLRIYAPLLTLAGEGETLRLAQASLARLERISDAPPQPWPTRGQVPAGHAVRFDDVHFGYPGAGGPALGGITLELPEGTTTALVGPSGAGKTTLLSLVDRTWDVDAGAVTIGGVDVRHLDADTLFDTVSTVPQQTWLTSGSVRENIALGRPDATAAQIEAAARAARLHPVVEALPEGYDTPVGEGGARLSGGERQRVCIARALLKDAPVLLLDEFTASLDASTERLVQEGLRELTGGRTVLVVAHRLRTIRSADRIVVLERGAVVEQGTHTGLLARDGRYAELWQQRERAARWRIEAG